ncbi:HEPN domain-containing protein [Mycolicibacterium novocastrense]|uniref:HEPN domain-containing protein n=1 Tax=Mycolicibacterium novocastrense TaxID=59813 RepID=UPI000AD09B25|nr:HEPN domain-containing protein [Mycolicibacterium novocastrense]
MADRFPDQVAETIGQFQVVSRPPADGTTEQVDVPQRTGVLRFRDNAVELEVSPGFNPVVSWTRRGPGSWAGGPPEERITDGAVVLGAIARQPGEVSLWGVRSVSRQLLGFPSPQQEEQRSREVLAADWCLVGALLSSDDTGFNKVELDVTGLHSFADMPSVRVEMAEWGKVPMSFVYDPPDAAAGATSTPIPGEVRFDPRATLPAFGGPDISVTTDTRLMMSFEGGVPLPVVVSDVSIPITSLLTILHGADCRVRRLSVSTPAGDSADVYGHIVDVDAPRDTAGDVLTTLARAGGADFVGRWLDLAKRTSPVPQILAAAYSGEFATVEAEALYLCTAAETLHRRLNPDERRWTAEAVEDGLLGLAGATMPDEVRQALKQALSQYLFEPSFPMRIEALATRVAAVLPGCVGRVNRWKRAVTDQRNALAHGLPPPGSGIDLTKMHAISRSLRWVLTVYLLLEAGAPAEQVSESTQANERYERDWRNWRRVWPRVFADPV